MSEDTRAVLAAERHLAWISKRWPDLLEARVKGTPRPWTEQAELTPAARAALSERDRLARLESRDAPGHSPAPLHLSALDLSVYAEDATVELADALAQAAGHDRRPPTMQAALLYLYGFLPREHSRIEGFDRHARDVLADIRERMQIEFSEMPLGQLLHALCPFCLGRTEGQPIGGARTLRVALRATDPDRTGEPEPVVLCEGGLCQPFAAECSLWLDGLPAWRAGEWEWLAARLLAPFGRG